MLEEIRKELHAAKSAAKEIRKELRAAKSRSERHEHKKRQERAQQEILELENKLRAAKHQQATALAARAAGKTETGALPDFFIIGQRRCGTTFLYHLLTLHPFVERATRKETHFFGVYFDEGVEWYRRHFPVPKWKEGRRTITGEATPLISNRLAPERVAQVIPQARLIALLRNPVDRTYSDYQHVVRKGRETHSFEEAIGLEGDNLDETSQYLSRSVYVDQLERWSEFYPREQMLILKSEDFYERPVETLKVVLEFLDLPEWEPDASELPKKQNKGSYERGMDPKTRKRLEEYFEPHNKRLYDYLGVDFGW